MQKSTDLYFRLAKFMTALVLCMIMRASSLLHHCSPVAKANSGGPFYTVHGMVRSKTEMHIDRV